MQFIRTLIARFRSPDTSPRAPRELSEAAHALRFVDRSGEDALLTRERAHAYADSFQRRY